MSAGAFILVLVGLLHFVQKRSSGTTACQDGGNPAGLILLAERLHKALQLLGAEHFLCHESLWAALYNKGPRSWDNEVEFCLSTPELSALRQDEGFVAKTFKTQELDLHYDVLDGSYSVQWQGPTGPMNGRLIPFRPGSTSPPKLMRRSGLKRAVLPEDCENQLLECFPAHLASPPLPLVKFGETLSLPAPREGIELQKYHYPDDWWLQRKIPPC